MNPKNPKMKNPNIRNPKNLKKWSPLPLTHPG
jgi:hypothetical protein